MSSPTTWRQAHETRFRSIYGTFRLRAFEFADGREHSALIAGAPWDADEPLIRVQSSCLTGTAFGAVLCDCRPQLEESMRRVMADKGGGYVLYLAQEGRGYGLVEKVHQLSLITDGLATTANAAGEGRRPDLRTYDDAFAMLDALLGNRGTVRLLTNNPKKIEAFQAAGYTVHRIPLETPPTEDNRAYLQVKKRDMGHLLSQV